MLTQQVIHSINVFASQRNVISIMLNDIFYVPVTIAKQTSAGLLFLVLLYLLSNKHMFSFVTTL